MIAWLLGILGVGGVGVGIAMFFGGGPMLLGIVGKVLGFAKGLSPKTWLYIAGAAALVAGFFIHQHKAHKAIKDAYTAGYNHRADEDAKALKILTARAAAAATNGARISQEERTKNDAENSNIRTAADAIGVRGPGAARCRPVGNSAAPVATGRDGPASRPGDAADGGLPVADGEADLAAVPWRWLVANAEEADLNRAEVLSWRDWYVKQAAEWDKLRQPLAKSTK